MTRIAYAWGCVAALPLVWGVWGCSSAAAPDEGGTKAPLTSDGGATDSGTSSAAASAASVTNPACGTNGTINANIGSKFLEIESAIAASTTCRGQVLGSAKPYNANLWVGTAANPGLDQDPDDGVAADFDNCPPGAAASYIDWADLSPAQHSCDDVTNDTSAFGNGSCVFAASSPKKGDITGTAFASNASQLYLSLTRADNSGDVAFTYVFTKSSAIAATCTCNSPGCTSGFEPRYAFQANDIVIGGDYPQSSGAVPVIDAWKYVGPTLTAATAMNGAAVIASLPASGASNANWSSVSNTGQNGGIVAAANIDATRWTSVLPSASTAKTTIDNLTFLNSQIALEMAVPMTALVGANFNICDAGSFHVDVLSRSSSSPGSDLKDYIGGIFLNLGSLDATPVVSAGCDTVTAGATKVDYSVSGITARDGTKLTPDATTGEFTGYSCSWTCTSPGKSNATASTCKGTLTGLAAGSWTCSVSVAETGGDQCSKSFSASPVTVVAPITLDPTLAGTCTPSFAWNAKGSGGSGTLSCSWSFSGPAGTPASASSCSSTANLTGPIGTGGANVSGSVTVTDSRGCSVSANSNVTRVYSPASVSIAPNKPSLTCQGTGASLLSSSNDTVRFTATVTGGNAPAIGWVGPTCSAGSTTCDVEFAGTDYCPSQSVHATVTDTSCPNAVSRTYTVAKQTSIVTSLNP